MINCLVYKIPKTAGFVSQAVKNVDIRFSMI